MASPPILGSPVVRALVAVLAGLFAGSALAGVAAAVRGGAPYLDPDFWWALEAGRWTLEHGDVPRVNTFGYTAPDQPWVFHEWLQGLLLALAEPIAGEGLPAWVAGANAVLVIGLLGWAAAREPTPTRWTAAAPLGGLAVLIVLPALALPRPTFLAFGCPLVVALLALRPRLDPASAFALVAVQAIWTGLHGSFPLGVVLVLAGLWEHRADPGRRLSVAAAGAALAVANPYGLELPRLVLEYLSGAGRGSAAGQWVQEFEPLWLRPDPKLVLGAAVLAAVTSVVARRHPARALVMALLLVMAVRQERHLGLATLLALPVLRDPLARALPERLGLRVDGLTAGAFLATALALAVGVAAAQAPGVAAVRGDPDFVRAMARVPDGARLFVPFQFGGPALYLAHGRGVTVFYDERNDPYPAEVARDAFRLSAGDHPAPAEVLAEHGTTAVLVPSDHALTGLSGWTATPVGEWTLLAPGARPQ